MSSLLPDFFSNAEATKSGSTDIEAPAFSLTKVQAGLGALIAAVAGAVPASVGANTTILVAAIAAGTIVMLGVFGLAAVDMSVRQRAREAKLRWPEGGGNGSKENVILVPDQNGLILQSKHNGDEYEVLVAELDGETVKLVAHRGDDFLQPTFQPPA